MSWDAFKTSVDRCRLLAGVEQHEHDANCMPLY